MASELLRTSTVPFGVSEFVVPLGALVNVRSLDRSVAFYSEVLGLEVRLRDPQVAILAEPREPNRSSFCARHFEMANIMAPTPWGRERCSGT